MPQIRKVFLEKWVQTVKVRSYQYGTDYTFLEIAGTPVGRNVHQVGRGRGYRLLTRRIDQKFYNSLLQSIFQMDVQLFT